MTRRKSDASHDRDQSPAEYFASVIVDPEATTSEKLRAAKELDAITRRAGSREAGKVADMTRAEIQDEIARVTALLGG